MKLSNTEYMLIGLLIVLVGAHFYRTNPNKMSIPTTSNPQGRGGLMQDLDSAQDQLYSWVDAEETGLDDYWSFLEEDAKSITFYNDK